MGPKISRYIRLTSSKLNFNLAFFIFNNHGLSTFLAIYIYPMITPIICWTSYVKTWMSNINDSPLLEIFLMGS